MSQEIKPFKTIEEQIAILENRGYYDVSSFEDEQRFNKFTDDYQNAIQKYGDKKVFVQHHNDVYNGKFPIWVLVELLTLGTLSRLFKNLPKDIRQWAHACCLLVCLG